MINRTKFSTNNYFEKDVKTGKLWNGKVIYGKQQINVLCVLNAAIHLISDIRHGLFVNSANSTSRVHPLLDFSVDYAQTTYIANL